MTPKPKNKKQIKVTIEQGESGDIAGAPMLAVCGNHTPKHSARSFKEIAKKTLKFGCKNWKVT